MAVCSCLAYQTLLGIVQVQACSFRIRSNVCKLQMKFVIIFTLANKKNHSHGCNHFNRFTFLIRTGWYQKYMSLTTQIGIAETIHASKFYNAKNWKGHQNKYRSDDAATVKSLWANEYKANASLGNSWPKQSIWIFKCLLWQGMVKTCTTQNINPYFMLCANDAISKSFWTEGTLNAKKSTKHKRSFFVYNEVPKNYIQNLAYSHVMPAFCGTEMNLKGYWSII